MRYVIPNDGYCLNPYLSVIEWVLPGTAKCLRGIEVSFAGSDPIQSALLQLPMGLVFMLPEWKP